MPTKQTPSRDFSEVRTLPWHHNAAVFDKPCHVADALAQGGLLWEVEKRPIWFETFSSHVDDGGGLVQETMIRDIQGRSATVRTDTQEALGIVSDRYKIIQNADALSVLDPIIDRSELVYQAAGTFGGGRIVWVQAKLPGHIQVGKGDPVEKHLLLVTSHDKTWPLTAMMTPIRPACMNTLNMALKTSMNKITVRHTAQAAVQIEEATRIMGLTNEIYALMEKQFQALAKTTVSAKVVKTFLENLIPSDEGKDASTRTQDTRNSILHHFESGRGSELVTAKGTAWGLVNAIAEWVDYGKQGNKDSDKAAYSRLFGSGLTMKNRAYELAMVLTKK